MVFFSEAYLGTGNIARHDCGEGEVVCIEVLSLEGTKDWDEFSKKVGQEWMKLGGVPHLAKQYEHLPNIYEHITKV